MPELFTRRALLQSASAAMAAAPFSSPAAVATAQPSANTQRLLTGWEHYRGNLGGIWEVWRGKKASDNVTWERVASMPHCFNARDAVDPDAEYYQGPGWYRATLEINNPYPSGRTLLHFEGAGQKSQVFVDLEPVGSHVGGYDEWIVDITAAAERAARKNKGKIPVAVFCDNSRDAEMIPSSLSDFNVYGGLYRYVNLVYVPAVSLERVHINASIEPGSPKGTVSISARLYNPAKMSADAGLHIAVIGPGGKSIHTSSRTLAATAGQSEIALFSVDAPELWSPAKPSLYTCTVTLNGEQAISGRFGFRHYEFVKHGPFKLNGERLLLRGTHRHEDHAGLAAAMPEELIRREMRMIKDVGANFIRLGHYQQSRIVLDCCDDLGLLVWEEIPWCRGGIGGDRYKEQGRRMLRSMIDQHRNHPAIILWGLGNENDWPGDFPSFDEPGIRAFLSELNDIAHKEDPSRLTTIRRCDFAKDIPDVYSPSIWAGWYRGRYTEYKSSTEKEMKSVGRFFHAEWGGDSHARRHSEDPDAGLAKIAMGQGTGERGLDYLLTGGQSRASKDGDWSESYICNLFDWHLKEQETMPWLTGAAQWIFKDFSTPLRPENPVPRMNQKGLVERDLTPKESYYVFQSYWSEAPMARIYAHTWPVRWGAKDEQKLVKVYSNCPQAELFVNGDSAGVKKRDSQDFPAAGLRWLVRFRGGQNHLKVVARKNGTEVVDEITVGYETRKWARPARLVLTELARKGSVVTVQAALFDTAGVPCLDARNLVRFAVAGDGKLIDNLGTSTGSRAVEMYNGRAVINVQKTGPLAAVSVSAKDLPTALLTVG